MISAGYETTVNLLDQAIYRLLTMPGLLARLHAGAFSWSALVEETLRCVPPVPNLPLRYAVEDIDIAGQRIEAGDALLACFAAANRDPHLHEPDPDDFDPRRASKEHLSFGYGPHFCLGAPLARLEAAVALPALFRRFPDMTLDCSAGAVRTLGSFVAQGHQHLPVRLAGADEAGAAIPIGRALSIRGLEATAEQMRHDNPRWPVRSPADAANALLLHDECPSHCSTRAAAVIVSRNDYRYFRDRGHIESDSWTTHSG